MLTEIQKNRVLELVKRTKPLIYREMTQEKVTVKGAADYVTNVDFAVQEFLKNSLYEEFPLVN